MTSSLVCSDFTAKLAVQIRLLSQRDCLPFYTATTSDKLCFLVCVRGVTINICYHQWWKATQAVGFGITLSHPRSLTYVATAGYKLICRAGNILEIEVAVLARSLYRDSFAYTHAWNSY